MLLAWFLGGVALIGFIFLMIENHKDHLQLGGRRKLRYAWTMLIITRVDDEVAKSARQQLKNHYG